jgi:RNA polymerase sigma factor (sigma-70 family)
MSPREDSKRLNLAMTRLAAGDRSAAREVFEGLWPTVHAFCVRHLSDSLAEDAAQRALVRVFEQAEEFDPEGDALAWALELALWECRTENRRLVRSRERLVGERRELERLAARVFPEAALELQVMRRPLHVAISSLPSPHRETLLALLTDEDPVTKPATWRKRKERALRRLKRVWKSLYGIR